jgi:hypothetical protein
MHKKCGPFKGNDANIKKLFENTQLLNFADKSIKAVIINMYKKLK